MLFITLLPILSSNAVSNVKEKSISYSRLVMLLLTFTVCIVQGNMIIKPLSKTIGLYGSLFNIDLFTQSFNTLILYITCGILILSGFYSKSLFNNYNTDSKYTDNKDVYSRYTDNKDADNKDTVRLLSDQKTDEQEKESKLYNYIKDVVLNKRSDIYNITEYALTILFIICGAISLISASDLISIFLSIELQSYGLYILCTLHRDSESATGSALMYFLLGGLSSCFILFGFAILYANSGTTSMDNIYIMSSVSDTINNLNYNNYYMTISLIMIMVGFLFKVSAAPFHFWSPNVYDGIPTIVTTFVAIIAKISIFAFILVITLQLSFAEGIYADNTMAIIEEEHFTWTERYGIENITSGSTQKYAEWKNVILFSSLMSLLIGSLLGLTQNRIKRLFAYSTISHVGFILLALSVTSLESVQGYIFYIIQYTISNLNIFLILISIGFTLFRYTYRQSLFNLQSLTPYGQGEWEKDSVYSPIQLISQVKGYFHINSFIAISFAITLFSFVGIPPLIGFFAKQMVLSAALDKGYVFMTFVAIITSVIGAVYYLNLVKEVFFTKPTNYYIESALETSMNTRVNLPATQSVITLQKVHTNNITNNFINQIINKVCINSPLSILIGILTTLMLTFIYKPSDWFIIANILSITLFNL